MELRVSVQKAVRAAVPPSLVRNAVQAAARLPEVAARLPAAGPEAACTVRLTGDRELRRLNWMHLGEDAVTDVLSFPSGAPAAPVEDGYLGDIAISWPCALRQAADLRLPPEAEVAFLAVHGFLHLLGWDHAVPAGAGEMERLTLTALRGAGLPEVGGRL